MKQEKDDARKMMGKRRRKGGKKQTVRAKELREEKELGLGRSDR